MKHVYRVGAIALLFITSACGNLFAPEPANDPVSLFDSFWDAYDREYAGFHDRGVNWNEVRALHRPRVSPSTTPAELFDILSDLVAVLDDSHVSLTSPFGMFLSNRRAREGVDRDLFDIAVVRDRYLHPGFTAGHRNAWVYGRITGTSVAYAYFRSVDRSFENLSRMLDKYPDANAYIVDLRQNDGGNHTHAFRHIGRFTDRTRYVFQSRTRNGPTRENFTPWHRWHLEPAGRHVDKPVIVLTDRYTPSAAERAVMAFRTLPNVIVVGDTTNGATSTKIPRELANGWAYSLSPQQVQMFDGASYEGRGLAPDIHVKNTRDDVAAGIDRVLEAAIAAAGR